MNEPRLSFLIYYTAVVTTAVLVAVIVQ